MMRDNVISHIRRKTFIYKFIPASLATDAILIHYTLLTMATLSDKKQFLGGQIFGSTYIPKGADLSGKTVVVTGANTGIGFECAKHLYVHCPP
jgi:hypothetical protein